MNDVFKYLFRFCCDPGFNDEQELAVLPDFIKQARVDDVTVFANVQEINTGHMDFFEQEKYISLMKKVKDISEPLSATMSVNHWHTIMHADLGKNLRDGQNFRRMVDKNGLVSSLCVCPLDNEWREYLTELFKRYAALDPFIIWIEDDFRLHNHAPLEWGGCFCDEHMKLYSKKAGKELSREEFINGVLKTGEVHPFRKIWLDVCRDTMVDTAEFIGNKIRKASSTARVGLMSSLPQVHATEGRNWDGVLKGLKGGDKTTLPPVCRPHLPTYREMAYGEYQMRFNAVTMLTRAFAPKETEFYPELENFPYSLFTKSRKFTRFQMLSALPAKLSGMTIDLYDLNGNGIVFEEGYQDTLKEVKDCLNALNSKGIFSRNADGVAVLTSELSSYTLHTNKGKSLDELQPNETVFASILPACGIPFYYSTEPDDLSGKIVAVSGQYFRNLTDKQITRLFEKNLIIMNGDSAQTLFEMGLEHLAGIKSIAWMEQDSGAFTYEEVVGDRICVSRKNARASAVLLATDAADIKYEQGDEALSNLCNSYREITAKGLVKYKNAVITPFGHFPNSPLEIPSMMLCGTRRDLFAAIVSEADSCFDKPPVVLNSAFLFPYYYKLDEKSFVVYLVNASSDELSEVKLYIGEKEFSKIIALKSDDTNTEGKEIEFNKNGETVTIKMPLGGLETALLCFE